MFALKRTSLGSVLDCVAPCLEESLLSLAKLRLEEVWKSFTEHTKRVDVWLKNDSEKRSVIFLRGFHTDGHATNAAIGSNWTRDLCVGMVESRQNASDASGEAGS